MSQGLRELHDRELDEALEQLLAPRLTKLLFSREAGHCARITALPGRLASGLCRRIRAAVGDRAQVHVLGRPPEVPASVAVTSTKLIELRNPDQHGQRPPLLVFVPPGTRAAAEDSFDVATFEDVAVGDVYLDLERNLLQELPAALRLSVQELLSVLDEKEWPYADSYSRARYLLTVRLNDSDPAAAGAAVFELGLVPDFELFEDASEVRTRTARNLQQMRELTASDRPVRQRVLRLGLTEPSFRTRFSEFLVRYGTGNPREWARRIVVDQTNWPLAFQRWPLRDERPDDVRVGIRVADLGLPMAGDVPNHAEHPTLSVITGYPFLLTGDKAATQLVVEFDVDPDPRTIPALQKFTVQLIAETGGGTGVTASVRVSTTARRTYKATLKKLRAAELDEGWHFLRVLPVDDEGIPLPVMPVHVGDHPAYESQRFYILADDELTDPAPKTKTLKEVGLTQALRRLEFQATLDGRPGQQITVEKVTWRDGKSVLHASFGHLPQMEVALSPVLADIQRNLLGQPELLGRWLLPIHSGMTGTPVCAEQSWPTGVDDALGRFLAARDEVFNVIRGDDDLVVEGRDLATLRGLIVEYADAYGELLSRQLSQAERADDDHKAERLDALRQLLQLDTIVIDHVDPHGSRTELTLVSPTHPLRLLWFTTWSELGQRWLDASRDVTTAVMSAAALSHERLRPLGFPLAVPRDAGRMALAGTDLGMYWGVYFPTDIADPRSLLTTVTTALQVPARRLDVGAASGKHLADRVERYLRLHPYVGTLTVNALNAGGAESLADMLLELQSRKGLKNISYELRLFSADPESLTEGAALAQLLRGEWRDTVDAELFHARRTAGAAPKLAVAVRPIHEFRSATSEHNAHITILLDAFGNEEFAAVAAERNGRLPVHGLVQDVTVDYIEDDDVVAWRKHPRHGDAYPLTGAEELTDLVASLPSMISHAVCAVATGQVGTRMVPNITLSLDAADSTLLHQAHQSSDWVITVDRTLGVEYFDNPHSGRRSDYVIDADDSNRHGLGHHIVVTSRSVDELCALLAPVIEQHSLNIDRHHTRTFFDQLRLLSGRLAFKIASATPTQRTEVLGLALARMFLDYQGALVDQVLVPLDAHLELYRDARRGDQVGESVGLQRTDLALFSLNARERKITCRLVEVKCYSSVPVSMQHDLESKIATQLGRSAEVLAERFDPHRTSPDRPDRTVMNAEFASLLRFYLDRAVRHNVMTGQAAAEAAWLLDRLDGIPAWQLEFTRTGLIFDLSGSGVSTDLDGGIEFHLVGRDIVEELVGSIPTAPDQVARESVPALSSLHGLDLTVPRLPDARFISPTREHTVASEADESYQSPTEEPAVPTNHPEEVEPPENHLAAGRPADSIAPAPEDTQSHPPRTVEQATLAADYEPEIVLGAEAASPQYGVIGEKSVAGNKVALDLNGTHTISLFGVQGGGKSYTLGTIIESASLPLPPINKLPKPLATIVFHYSSTLDYAPEFTSMVYPNGDESQIAVLRERYGVAPASLDDVVLLVPEDQLDERRAEHPTVEVLPLKFGSNELRVEHWRFLMGAIGNKSTYITQLQRIMKDNRRNLRLDVIRNGIDQSSLADNLKQLAHQRLELAAEYIDDTTRVQALVRPGRMIIVDLRDEFIEKDEALGLFVVLMELFAAAKDGGERFNKLVVFDEAHKYIDSPDLVAVLVNSVREMRHKGMSVLVASQDPPSVPISLIELSDHIILHKFTSPAWLKHLQKANAALANLTPARMANLTQGEAYVWANKASDNTFSETAAKIRLRPRVTRHGGATKNAVE